MIFLDEFQPIVGITVWDILALLWTYAHRPPKEMALEKQIEYLMESLELFARFLMEIQTDSKLRPSTVNATFSKEMPEKCMFGASIRCLVPVNEESAKSRVKYLRILELAADVENALTASQLEESSHPLGNCSELLPWEAMHEPSQEKDVVLYSRTLILPRKHQPLKIKQPCHKCQYVMEKMALHQLATICPY